MSVSAARAGLSRVLDRARSEAVVLERHGRPAGVLVSPERYAELLAAFEEVQDVAAFDAALAEEGANLPWGAVQAALDRPDLDAHEG
jgi:antitoxin Phd